jgi:hypothetical protein
MKRGPVSEASAVGWSRIDIDACAPLALLVAKSRALRVPMGLTPFEAFAEMSLVGSASRLLQEPCALDLSHHPTPTLQSMCTRFSSEIFSWILRSFVTVHFSGT